MTAMLQGLADPPQPKTFAFSRKSHLVRKPLAVPDITTTSTDLSLGHPGMGRIVFVALATEVENRGKLVAFEKFVRSTRDAAM